MKRIGILGGTFNPIHYGHLILAQSALEQFALDQVLFIPSGHSYMKENVLDAARRYEMTQLAIEDHPSFDISAIEAERSGNSYTFETLTILCDQHPNRQYEYIVGADTLMSMDTWRKPEIIFQKANILCAIRKDHSMEALLRKQEELIKRYGARIHFLETRSFDISSSEIRMRVHNKMNVSYFLPKKVLDYIKEHHLYETISINKDY